MVRQHGYASVTCLVNTIATVHKVHCYHLLMVR
jgi:hypothetical protein